MPDIKSVLEIYRAYHNEMLEGVFNGTIDPTNLDDAYYQGLAGFLYEAVKKGFGASIEAIKFGSADYELLEELRTNIYLFSAAKTFQQTLEMHGALVDEEGNLRSKADFREMASEIFTRYNGGEAPDGEELKGWLDTERNTAITQASNAAKWNSIQKQKEQLPYLRYVSENDELVCDICDPLDGICLPVDDPFWEEYSPSNHFNCRCVLEQLDVEEGADAESDDDEVSAAEEESKTPDEFKYNPGAMGEIFSSDGTSQHPYFSVPEEYQDFAKQNFGLPLPEAERFSNTELTKELEQNFKEFPRDEKLSAGDKEVENDSIKYFLANKEELTEAYIKHFGNVANTDDARKLFRPVGYTGANAAAVQEARSALSKEAASVLLERGERGQVTMFAGGSGSGKTSAIEKLEKHIKQRNDVIIDGNLSKYEGAVQKIETYLKAGKFVTIDYVYREPLDAWKNGVIKRMKFNKSEGGRVVPMSVFIQNTEGSYNAVRKLLEVNANEWKNLRINVIDNSLGKGKTDYMDMKKFNSIEFTSDLKDQLMRETRAMLTNDEITKEQFEALIK